MKSITDGTLAADLSSWTDHLGVVQALTHNAHGKPFCPECAGLGYTELLYHSPASRRYSCARKHLFASL